MVTKLIIIVGLSVAAVVGMFLLGKFLDMGNAEEVAAKKN